MARRPRPLPYDFTEYVPGAKGTIRPPTPERFERFRKRMVTLSRERSPEKEAAVLKATADLCGDHPSADDLAQLPDRVFDAFWRWLMAEYGGPESRR